MKTVNVLKFTLLVIGLLGVIASGFNTIVDGTFSGNLIGFISGGFLIFCFFSLDNLKKPISSKLPDNSSNEL
ncbi:hypothetical protein GTQ40_10915 [Flavobacteriaceae bacterium R38]|nr:hypothetical protein [Flavobacteriaceae bacterium R38]